MYLFYTILFCVVLSSPLPGIYQFETLHDGKMISVNDDGNFLEQTGIKNKSRQHFAIKQSSTDPSTYFIQSVHSKKYWTTNWHVKLDAFSPVNIKQQFTFSHNVEDDKWYIIAKESQDHDPVRVIDVRGSHKEDGTDIIVHGKHKHTAPNQRFKLHRVSTLQPTANPTLYPTKSPSNNPTVHPTKSPSNAPTNHPTSHPTVSPTKYPTALPTKYPSHSPTNDPTQQNAMITQQQWVHTQSQLNVSLLMIDSLHSELETIHQSIFHQIPRWIKFVMIVSGFIVIIQIFIFILWIIVRCVQMKQNDIKQIQMHHVQNQIGETQKPILIKKKGQKSKCMDISDVHETAGKRARVKLSDIMNKHVRSTLKGNEYAEKESNEFSDKQVSDELFDEGNEPHTKHHSII